MASIASWQRSWKGVIAAIVTAASLTACAEIPGIYYRIQPVDPALKESCSKLARSFAHDLNFTIKYSEYGNHTSRNEAICRVMLTNPGGHPNMSISVDLWNEGDIVVDVHEYRWGEWAAPSRATNDMGDRVLAIVKREYPDAAVTRFRPKRGLFGP